MVSIFSRFQSPSNTSGREEKMGNCPDFDTHMGGIFQHRKFVKADDINSIKDFVLFNPVLGLEDLFITKIF